MTSFVKFVVALFYLIGCWGLVPASIGLMFYSKYPYLSIIFIVSCGFLFLPSIIDIFLLLKSQDKENSIKKSNSKKIIIKITYLIGGVSFEIASILYWPTWEKSHIGIWIFRVGSVSYLIGSFFSIKELFNIYKNSNKDCGYYLWILCIIFYVIGSVFFIIGGILSQIGYFYISVYTWIIGSVGFAAGSTIGFIGEIKSKSIS